MTRHLGRSGLVLAAAAVFATMPLRAASPEPGLMGPIDSRTSDAPGIVGGPLEILIGVTLLGLATAAAA